MDINEELKQIKKLYGERMAHLCRELFPTILETKGSLLKLLQSSFNEDRNLAEDILASGRKVEFKGYIYSLLRKKETKMKTTNKTPEELMSEVQYNLYKCETPEDIARFKKYYSEDELLCTFTDGEDGVERLKTHHIFFAVRKDIDNIKRGEVPRREDDYGISVISIQFDKAEGNILSIKNRYNHAVDNPDATYSNNLENIKQGLTYAFNRVYGLDTKIPETTFELPNYTKANDGRMYKYNIEINGRYYCPNNMVIYNEQITRYPKDRYILIERYLLDKAGSPKTATEPEILPSIKQCGKNHGDSFTHTITGGIKCDIKKVQEKLIKSEDGEIVRVVTITPQDIEIKEGETVTGVKRQKDVIITLDKNNNIIGYENENVENILSNFLSNNKKCRKIHMPNVKKISDSFMANNKELTEIDFSNLKEVGNHFIRWNRKIKRVNLPELEKAGDDFLAENRELEEIELQSLISGGSDFLTENVIIKRIILPLATKFTSWFIPKAKRLDKINCPNLVEAGNGFLNENEVIDEYDLSKLKKIGDGALAHNANREEIFAKIKEIQEKSEGAR